MRKPRLFVTYGLAALIALALVTPSLVHAQAAEKGSPTELKADSQTSRGGGEDPNIKSRSVKNDPKNAPKAPPEEGEARGGWCAFNVINRTPWKIQMFVDGDYVGLVSSWGRANGTYSSGTHVIYGLAEFTDAPDITWGPDSISCVSSFTWRLTDSSHGYY